MSYKHLRTLSEVERHGFWLNVRCPACGREATFRPRDLISCLRPPYDLRSVASRLVCYDPPGCGVRGALVRPTDKVVSPDKAKAQPVMTTDRIPAGIDRAAWEAADWYGKRRLIRAARNR